MFKIYSPEPFKNDYLHHIFFVSLMSRKNVTRIDTLDGLKDSTILLDAEDLNPKVIERLKNDGNIIIAFDINDHTTPTWTYRNTPEIFDCDLIFKFAGIQKERVSKNIKVNDDLTCSTQDVPFMEEGEWDQYCKLKDRILPLPHVPWDAVVDKSVTWVPFNERIKKCLVRGSHQFFRYNLFLNLMRIGKASNLCSFFTSQYIHKYCDKCKEEICSTGGISYNYYRNFSGKCKNERIKWQEELTDGFWELDPLQWNCECPNMFYFFAEKFNELRGGIDIASIERVLNGFQQPMFVEKIISAHTMYADFKWLHSIYAPPRFWEAASVKTVSLVPRYTSEQFLFPNLEDGSHYLSYANDLSDLEEVVELSEEKYTEITTNAFDAYNKWVKRDGGSNLSSILIDHILTECKRVSS